MFELEEHTGNFRYSIDWGRKTATSRLAGATKLINVQSRLLSLKTNIQTKSRCGPLGRAHLA